ncbi:anthranilate synthase component I family protein [Hyphomonas sp.]|uniref:anthranilate synthase component I family protein n=1 Tax=Hyphomonas sp. TaxID=87 RepID=UPI00391B5B64
MICEALPELDPVTAAAALCGEDGFLWLDSADTGHPAGRWSYICVWPVSRLMPGAGPEAAGALKRWLAQWRAETRPGGAPFQGGAAGYVSYEAAAAFEPRFSSAHVATGAAPIELGMYDAVIAFDHARGVAAVYSAGLGGHGEGADDARARARIADLKARLAAAPARMAAPGVLSWTQVTSAAAFTGAVARAQEFIRAGDIYQANLAGLWTSRALSREEAFAHYLALRVRAPAPFAAFGIFRDRMIASLSPERLVRGEASGRVLAEPIKGTIRRGRDAAEDAARRAELIASEKDRAENVMIVDLLRNDLSRVCTSSSVHVPSLCRLESFAGLHHLVSSIEGQLAAGQGAADLFGAVFPGGSITGAPKLRAMEVIDTLEPAARGAFCGSLLWIGHDGAMDASILIRTLDMLPDETRLWAGAGITLLSDPQAEYAEICLKAERLTAAAPLKVEAA